MEEEYTCPNCGEKWVKVDNRIQNVQISNSIYTSLDNKFEDCPSCEADNVINWLPKL